MPRRAGLIASPPWPGAPLRPPGLGDKNDRYGGLGRNGAQKTPEASNGNLLEVGDTYHFSDGRLYNLNSDAFITGHSDVAKAEVVYALLNAIAGAREP